MSTPVPLSRELSWAVHAAADRALALQAEPSDAAEAEPTEEAKAFLGAPPLPRPKGVRTARRSYPRDALTLPAMVLGYNLLLMWTMFQIDVRASSF